MPGGRGGRPRAASGRRRAGSARAPPGRPRPRAAPRRPRRSRRRRSSGWPGPRPGPSCGSSRGRRPRRGRPGPGRRGCGRGMSIPPTMNAAISAKPTGSSRKRVRPLIPEPEPDCSFAGPSTATPSARSRAARSNAPGRPFVGARAAVAPGAVVWAKSCPGLGLGDGGGDHLALAVDRRDPRARGRPPRRSGCGRRRLRPARGRAPRVAVSEPSGWTASGTRGGPPAASAGVATHERRQRDEQGEWGPDEGQPTR